MTTEIRQPAKPLKPIKGPGLTNAGVILLQFLVILVAEAFEYQFTKVGVITGIALLFAFFGAIYLGRPGTAFAAVVNPPIAFFCSTIFLMATIGGTGLHLTKIGVDLIANLGGVAPFLAIGA
jgi:hypothetical protein